MFVYVQCVYNVYHGSWRDFGTAVGVYSMRVSGEMLGGKVLGSLRSHGTRFAYGRLRAQALSQPCLVMGRTGVCACGVIS